MSYLPFVLLAYFFNSIAVTVDKFLLTKHIQSPFVYIFYISVVSLFVLFMLPFTHTPSWSIFILASFSTVLWTIGLFFLYKGLQQGIATRVVPVIGTLVPLILLFFAIFAKTINQNEIWAASILILALIFLTLPVWKGQISTKEITFEFLSAAFFAVSYILLRQAFLQENFLTVMVYSRLVLIPAGIFILFFPSLRKIVLSSQNQGLNFFSKAGLLFLIGQIAGGSQELLLTYSVSLADPSVVNSLQGTQYVFLFIFGLSLSKRYPAIFKENLSKIILLGKIIGIILICAALYILALQPKKSKPYLGVTFSPRYAQSLGLNPKEAYLKTLDELKVKYIRLPVYWDEIQKEQNSFDRTYLNDYLTEAQNREVSVILVVGLKQPRWPECFTPHWVKGLSKTQFQQAVLDLVSNEVKLYKSNPSIKVWQVENEPFFLFGQCEDKVLTFDFVKKEIDLVKSLDNRPVLIVDSGELSTWRHTIKLGDIFGTTLYRTVWSPNFGIVDYPIPPAAYQIKSDILRWVFNKNGESIVSELQAEPWSTKKDSLVEETINDQISQFPPEKIYKNVEYAKQTNFSQIYLWGVEWWYYMKTQGYPEYWETAKNIFK